MYCVYIHTVPNGKIYIGCTKDIEKRWNNGEGYKPNEKFYNDIIKYGWNNIKHEIIAQINEKEIAYQLEAVLIALKQTENPLYGYNQTSIYNDAMNKYVSKIPYEGILLEKADTDNSFFENYNLPFSVCEELINQWIFNEQHRKILKDRLLNGLSYVELSKKYSKSTRQLKNIVCENCNKLEKRM